jgi:hypothetical protein
MDSETIFLVERWDAVHDLLEPSRRLLLEVIGHPEFPHQDILQLGLFASRLGYWQVFCCLKRYYADFDKHPEGVLESLPFGEMWSDRRIWHLQKWTELDHPFLGFCARFKFVDPEIFVPSAYAIATVLPVQWQSFEAMSSFSDIIEECLQLNPMPPNTPEDLDRCVRAAKAQLIQAAALRPAW